MPGRLQIKLSALFLLVLAVSLPLSCIAYLRHQVDDFHRAAAPFEKVTGRPVQATGDGMGIVSGRYGLTQLNLMDADLDDAVLLALKVDLEQLPELHALSLARTTVGNDGLAALANLHALRSLNLAGTRVTTAGLVHLKQLHGLRSLGLEGTQVTDSGVKQLQRALPKCEIRY